PRRHRRRAEDRQGDLIFDVLASAGAVVGEGRRGAALDPDACRSRPARRAVVPGEAREIDPIAAVVLPAARGRAARGLVGDPPACARAIAVVRGGGDRAETVADGALGATERGAVLEARLAGVVAAQGVRAPDLAQARVLGALPVVPRARG